jgi:periplasmic protein TonB
MFEDSLFDSGAGSRPRKTWTKLLSFVIEACAIVVLVLLPLIYTQALPKQLWTNILELPPPPAGAPLEKLRTEARPPQNKRELVDSGLHVPTEIPRKTSMRPDDLSASEGPPSMKDMVPGGAPEGVPNAVITDIARATLPPMLKPPPPQKLRVSSGVAQGMLVYQLKPQYPRLAMQARIQGTVVLQAVIGKDGSVQDLRLVSGHPMLAPAAIEAVKQWRYRPYMLNGEPVEVDTQINVNFSLGGG